VTHLLSCFAFCHISHVICLINYCTNFLALVAFTGTLPPSINSTPVALSCTRHSLTSLTYRALSLSINVPINLPSFMPYHLLALTTDTLATSLACAPTAPPNGTGNVSTGSMFSSTLATTTTTTCLYSPVYICSACINYLF
jgi:hypothetical protein